MLSVAFILGKRVRQPIVSPQSIGIDKPIAHCEVNRSHPANVHYHNYPGDYSFRTMHDYTQAVGKLYKGYVDD